MRSTTLWLLLVGVGLGGCAGPGPLYDWGQYQSSILRMYDKDKNFVADEEIDLMAQEIEQTLAKDKAVPPGKYAYLAYLYSVQGDPASAAAAFEKEREAFPESAPFMDRLRRNLQ